ncbi:acetyltransferase [Anaeromyxobacter paludicola]|uniref:Acetyltransferase n=1 Tax=Anaeromyxobacter paludicola TaxID=2918171 RepID=A0ABM7X5K0_9BACT|nr:acetyltransferase [Anaeromyxobacter paludicola]BDG07093.1 acetyltransferase [Anaeromyxobacter paludicola]
MASTYILGGGGLGREARLYLDDARLAGADLPGFGGFLEDYGPNDGRPPVAAGARLLERIRPEPGDRFLVAVGDPLLRARLAARLKALELAVATLIHPRAWVAPDALLGEGCLVAPFAFVGPGARLGDHVALNTHASVGHDGSVGDHTVLSPYAVLNGNAAVGDSSFLGTGAAVVPHRRVGRRAQVAAGAVVTRDVPDFALASGNPAVARVLYAP